MSTTAPLATTRPADDAPARAAARIVEAFLAASMIPDPERARGFTAPGMRITFTGGRRFTGPAEIAAFNAARYRRVQKKFERTDVVPGAADDEFIVYNTGTLYGEWPDGTAFEGNRYIDRFVVTAGRITRMDVWNDSAELLLARAGLAEDRAGA